MRALASRRAALWPEGAFSARERPFDGLRGWGEGFRSFWRFGRLGRPLTGSNHQRWWYYKRSFPLPPLIPPSPKGKGGEGPIPSG